MNRFQLCAVGLAGAAMLAGTAAAQAPPATAQSYADAAVDALTARNNAAAIDQATRSLAIQETVNALFIRGAAYANDRQWSKAISDYDRAKLKATAGHADAATLNAIDVHLVTALLFGGQPERGLALAREVRVRAPGEALLDDAVATYYAGRAQSAVKSGDTDRAVSLLENGAAAAPRRAGELYVQAADALAMTAPPNWLRVQVEARKALAIDPNDARANLVVGIALANGGDKPAAISFLQKARLHADADAGLLAQANDALKRLGAP